ncbi:MAG: integrase, partial [Clostridia bacterium]
KTFYSIEKDIVRLADLLGHSSVDTTRIYTIESGDGHLARLERVQRTLLVT